MPEQTTLTEAPVLVHAPGSGPGYLAADLWHWLDVESTAEQLQAARPTVVPLALWLEHRTQWQAQGLPRGVVLTLDEEPGALAGQLDGLSLIAIHFSSFVDGRGFSHARHLRRKLQWQGELRAVGDVLVDTVNYLARTGFDSFQLKEGHKPEDALRQLQWFTSPYQRGYRPIAPEAA